MLNKIIKTIHKLRLIVLLGVSAAFLIQFQMNPLEVGRYIGAGFSDAVGMKTTVLENPDSRLARQLKEKEAELDMREQNLDSREEALESKLEDRIDNSLKKYFFALAGGIILLLVLIIANFALDYKRKKSNEKNS